MGINLRFQKVRLIEIIKSIIWKKPVVKDPSVASASFEGLFKGWFNNHMTVLLMMLQNPKPRTVITVQRIEFFLHDLEHHFMPFSSSKAVWDIFRYLKRYLKVYPNVRRSHSIRAIEMVGRIYQILGLKWAFQDMTASEKEKIKKDKSMIHGIRL